MYFIAESGSTKCDWMLVDGKNNQSFCSTMGFNPYFHSSDLIETELKKVEKIVAIASDIKGVYFYGAGCSSEELNETVKAGLEKVFVNAKIIVDHDLLACAYATYSGRPQISCIIGTGSNSCYFDGEQVSEVVPALGYILGDEGSGSFFGKQLIANFLYHRLPKEIEQDFIAEYNLSKDDLIEHVYMMPNANVFIASFMPFIAKHKDNPYFKDMVREGFKKFIDVHVTCYNNYKEVEVNFVGSISQIFEQELREAADFYNVTIGSLIRRPAEALVAYHLKYILNTEIA
jgi:N-acetylglucosamine kinase-like BadF-type ATPase